MMRVMLGGAHHPAIINDDKTNLAKAIKEIDSIYGLTANLLKHLSNYGQRPSRNTKSIILIGRQSVAEQCAKTPGLYLCANYLDGISFNDCVNNAKILAGKLSI